MFRKTGHSNKHKIFENKPTTKSHQIQKNWTESTIFEFKYRNIKFSNVWEHK